MSGVDRLPGEAAEISAEQLLAPYLNALEYARRHAHTDAQRDLVMSAIYDALIGVESDVQDAN
jgi:hypothetical protein